MALTNVAYRAPFRDLPSGYSTASLQPSYRRTPVRHEMLYSSRLTVTRPPL